LHLLARFDFGGVEKHMTYIWAQADHHRYRHCFAAIGQGGAIERQLVADGAEVTCLGMDPTIPRLGAAWAATRLLLRTRPDVIHCHGPEPCFYGLPAALLARIPLRIGEEVATPVYSERGAFVFRQVYRAADAVLGVCEAVRSGVIERRIAPAEKCHAILNPILIAKDPLELEQDPEHLTLLFAGRFVPQKNPEILLPVLQQIRSEGIPARLWFVGDGPGRRALESATAELGLNEHVTFWGYRDDVEDFMRQADVYVLPSIFEGLPIAIGEAMGCRLPVLCSDVGGCSEVVEQGRTGFLVEPGEQEPILKALRALWEMGPERRRAMCERARAVVIERCDPGRYVERLEAFYDSLGAGRGR
jgi:glycosyltransferase involved in cell wall biosynthesis